MELFIVCVATLLASALTLCSGFGLGTLLTPSVSLFFRMAQEWITVDMLKLARLFV